MVKLREIIIYIFTIALLIASYFYVSSAQTCDHPQVAGQRSAITR